MPGPAPAGQGGMNRRPQLVRTLLDAYRLPWLLALCVTLALWLAAPLSVARLDLLLYDLLSVELLSEPPAGGAADTRMPVVVAIDDASLHALGPWPWPRSRHAELIDRLSRAGVAGIGYSVLFAEPSDDEAGDAALADAVRRAASVVLPVAPLALEGGGVGALEPWSELASAAARLAHVDVEIDADGLSRRLFVEAGAGSAQWPALSWALIDVSRKSRPLACGCATTKCWCCRPNPGRRPRYRRPTCWPGGWRRICCAAAACWWGPPTPGPAAR